MPDNEARSTFWDEFADEDEETSWRKYYEAIAAGPGPATEEDTEAVLVTSKGIEVVIVGFRNGEFSLEIRGHERPRLVSADQILSPVREQLSLKRVVWVSVPYGAYVDVRHIEFCTRACRSGWISKRAIALAVAICRRGQQSKPI